ncbi:MAG: hypothetical protein K6E20_06320 [Acholeplasmatales bacterium]|nr:hypothetical protein [Acholeplasmatales bacterium]
MRDKELFNYVKSSTDDIKINDYSDSIIANTHHEVKPKSLIKRKNKYFLPVSLATLGVLGAATALVVFVANSNSSGTKTKTRQFHDKVALNASYEMLALNNVISSTDSNVKSAKKTYTNDELSGLIGDVNSYLYTCEQLKNSDQIIYKFDQENTNSNYSDYKYMMSVSYLEDSLNCYYNVVTSKDDEYSIKGVVIIDEIDYTFFGEGEEENDESEITLTVNLSETLSIKVKNEVEIEKDEVEYEYSLERYNGSNLVESIKYEVDIEDDEASYEVVINSNNVETKYEFEKSSDEELDENLKVEKGYLSCIEGKIEKTNCENLEFFILVYDNYYLYIFEQEEDNLFI